MGFYPLTTRPQQTNMNRLLHAFPTQYAPNQDVLKTKVKALSQQPGQTTLSFFREFRDLNAYLVKVGCLI